MALVFGPLLSLAARGTVKGSLTMKKRYPLPVATIKPGARGGGYVDHVLSAAEIENRASFAKLVKVWQGFTGVQKDLWQSEANYVGNQLSGYHTYMAVGIAKPYEEIGEVVIAKKRVHCWGHGC